MTYCAVSACILAIMAQFCISLPSLVPITMQTLGIYLMGLILKPKLAFISSFVYLLMGAIGLPVFSGFTGGISSLVGPAGGYIFSFPLVALIISIIVDKKDSWGIKVIALIIGTIICYSIGTLWFIYVTKASLVSALAICVIPFLLGDSIKIVISLILSSKLKRLRNS